MKKQTIERLVKDFMKLGVSEKDAREYIAILLRG